MARMSSVIYVMHRRVSETGEQANAHLDVLSLNSMQTHYVSPFARVVSTGAEGKSRPVGKKRGEASGGKGEMR